MLEEELPVDVLVELLVDVPVDVLVEVVVPVDVLEDELLLVVPVVVPVDVLDEDALLEEVLVDPPVPVLEPVDPPVVVLLLDEVLEELVDEPVDELLDELDEELLDELDEGLLVPVVDEEVEAGVGVGDGGADGGGGVADGGGVGERVMTSAVTTQSPSENSGGADVSHPAVTTSRTLVCTLAPVRVIPAHTISEGSLVHPIRRLSATAIMT